MPNPVPGAAALEAQLEICQDAIRKALASADAVDPAADEYGHAVSSAHNRAIRYLKMSAKLGLALAKLKGEHTSNIRIHKTETLKPVPALEQPRYLKPPTPDRFHAAWQKFTADTFGWQWGDDDGDDDKDLKETAAGQGDPLSISEGSNTP